LKEEPLKILGIERNGENPWVKIPGKTKSQKSLNRGTFGKTPTLTPKSKEVKTQELGKTKNEIGLDPERTFPKSQIGV